MLMDLRRQTGFTLIETLSAITVFFIVTIGVFPLLASSIRGSNLARSQTLGKNIGEQAMEHVRGLPYHNSRTTQRLDVLDFYYPQYVPSGTFTTQCLPGTADPACPFEIPTGHKVILNATFVRHVDTTASPPPPESYAMVLPDPSYAWNATGGANQPPPTAQYLRLQIVTEWEVRGDRRRFSLETLLGDRKTGALTIDGLATIDHFLQVRTSFDIAGSRSDLTVTAGAAESRIESRHLTTADQSVNSIVARITDSNNPREFPDAEAVGETGFANAPPDTTTGEVQPAGADILNHPNLTFLPRMVVAFSDTTVSNLLAQQSLGLPSARGRFSFAPGEPFLRVNNQVETTDEDTTTQPSLLLADEGHVVWMDDVSGRTIFGETSSSTTGPGIPREVRSRALLQGGTAAAAGTVNILPAQFTADQGPVIQVSDFRARVECPSTGVATTTPVAEWSARLRYWAENNNAGAPFGDNRSAGAYVEVEVGPGLGLLGDPATGSPRPDPLAALVAAPPMVHEVQDDNDPATVSPIGSERDTYLFPVQHDHTVDVAGAPSTIVHNHPGYLSEWSSLRNTVTSKDSAGRSTSGRIDGAIRMTTTPTDPNITPSSLNISIGSLSCHALDRRL